MRTGFYPKLAWDSIRKNKRLYIPYILTCAGMVMMFYIIHYLSSMPILENMSGGTTAKQVLGFGVWVVEVFALIFLAYTNSFLMRRRQKEFGLYNILGMSKKNLSAVYVWENLSVYVIAIFSGLACGIALSKMAEIGLVRMTGGTITYDFTVNIEAVLDTFVVFGAIFCLLFIKGLINLWRLNAVSLLKSENAGEKPPKANYLLGIGGIVILAAAYYIAISIKSPLLALGWFFIAVIMVILATYMIFISGSVMLCRILQKNKRYYYNKNHFVSVSSMAYRMKRNGAGLASICVLSTMVLVMMLGAGSLYFGAEDSLKARYPKDISVLTDFLPAQSSHKESYSLEKANYIISKIDKIILQHGVKSQNVDKYVSVSVTALLADGKLVANPELVNSVNAVTMKNVCTILFISLDDYNNCMDKNETLENNEVLIHCLRCSYNESTINLTDKTVLKVKKQVDDMIINEDAVTNIIPSVCIVVNDLQAVCDSINSEFPNVESYFCCPRLHYGFNTDLKQKDEIKLAETIRQYVRELNYTGECGFYSYNVECREEERGDFYGTYGGIFYLGIILSIVFLLATVLIIYYKQITEGYEDESRFAIMQKIGMTKKDIRKSINSQMLTVFLLPLLTAVLHLSFAFPMIQKLLVLFQFNNIALMVIVLVVTVLIFGVFYGAVYKITSNAYFAIVSGKKN